MKKKQLRKLYMEKRMAMSQTEVNFLSEKIFNNFLSEFEVSENQKVHIFLSIAKFREINTFYFIRYFRERNVNLYVPKIYNDDMISLEFSLGTPMEVSDWGIAEPKGHEDIGIKDYDIIITPLLYCDENGNRVGFGKGYYDSFFKTLNPECLKIGVSFFEPNETIDDVSERDVQLDYLVTPERILSFGGTL